MALAANNNKAAQYEKRAGVWREKTGRLEMKDEKRRQSSAEGGVIRWAHERRWEPTMARRLKRAYQRMKA